MYAIRSYYERARMASRRAASASGSSSASEYTYSMYQSSVITSYSIHYTKLYDASEREKQTRFYLTKPGPYDDWLIEFGYSPALDDPEAEAARLEAILARSTEPQLAFGNDADDMRAPGVGMDPRVNIFDMSSDAVTYAAQRMDLIQHRITSYNVCYTKLLREQARCAPCP